MLSGRRSWFDVANQLNRSAALLSDREERTEEEVLRGTLGSYENEVSLSQHELDLVDDLCLVNSSRSGPRARAAAWVLGSKIGRSAARLRCFSLCCTRKAFNPFLVIAVERTGILPPELLEEERPLLRFLSTGS
jgi:hypothetical protein